MQIRSDVVVALCAASLALAAAAGASSVYEEGGPNELSGDKDAPTVLPVSGGSNTVGGSVSNTDDDFFSFEVPAGESLEAIILLLHSPSTTTSYLGVHLGPSYANLSSPLGDTNFDSGDIGSDLLLAMTGGPLGPGDYSFWIDEGSLSPESYRFDFQITPEPGSAALLALGLVALGARNRRGKRR